jgi:threonylcarbamoyladenosine tRNA methylthiotransferase MtaB
MNRHYTARDFLRRLDEIRSYLDEPAITSDIMVGFPGETEEVFKHTVEVAKTARFARTHIFPFSLRPGTSAYRLPGRVPAKIIKRRKEELKEVVAESAKEFKKKFLGQRARILVEYPYCSRPPTSDPLSLSGYTERYLRVKFPGPESLIGEMVDVEITSLNEGLLEGRLLQ